MKPENVLLDENGHCRLVDFGLSETNIQNRAKWEKLTLKKKFSESNNIVRGTADYMAPELFKKNAHHDYKVDLWALGVLIYEMIVSLPAFNDDTEE